MLPDIIIIIVIFHNNHVELRKGMHYFNLCIKSLSTLKPKQVTLINKSTVFQNRVFILIVTTLIFYSNTTQHTGILNKQITLFAPSSLENVAIQALKTAAFSKPNTVWKVC